MCISISTYLSIYLSIYLSVNLFIYLWLSNKQPQVGTFGRRKGRQQWRCWPLCRDLPGTTTFIWTPRQLAVRSGDRDLN